MLTQEILEMLFEETYGEVEDPISFTDWVTMVGYNSGWSDQRIYNNLPPYIQAWAGEFVMNESWFHGGM